MSRAAPSREELRLKLIGIGYLFVWRIARLLPERWAGRMFERSSERSYRKNARRRGIVRENLIPVVGRGPELDATVREAFRSYGRYWMETFRMQDLSSAELNRRYKGTGLDILERVFKEGRGAVLATPHVGNWDAGGRWVAERWPLTVVVEVLRPRMLFDRFVRHRRGLGMTIIPLVRGGDATKRCLEKIREGEFVALVSDRDLSGSGVEVTMFGRRTKMPAGPAVLALRGGVPLIPAVIYQAENGEWDTWVMEPIDGGLVGETPANVAALTQRLAGAYEQMIRRDPAQWHAFSSVWLPDGPDASELPASERPADAPPAGSSAER